MISEENTFHIREHIILPSDSEEREAKKVGISYIGLRSSKVKIYSQAEIDSLDLPEKFWPFTIWYLERKWRWLLNSKSCRLRGES